MSHPRIRHAQRNEYFAAAVEQLPGYLNAKKVAEDAEQLLEQLVTPHVTVASPLESGTITGEWLDACATTRLAAAEVEARRAALTELRDTARSIQTSAVTIHADRMLATLNADLTAIIAHGRTVCADLGNARDPRSALEAGPAAAHAWTQIRPLLGDYRNVRNAQNIVMAEFPYEIQRAKSTANLDTLATDLLLSNLDELAPTWRQPGGNSMTGGSLWEAPWPTAEDEHFVWLCTSPAQPWIPTLTQLEDLWQNRTPPPITTAPAPFPTRAKDGFIRVVNAR
ncbi:hypothetical protein ACWDNI_16075 [Nocardia niigatensis]